MYNTLNGRVLLLDASYKPLGTMAVKNVIKKLSNGSTSLSVVEWDSGRVLRSGRIDNEYPVPSVVRMTYYLNIRQRKEKSGTKRLSVFMRDKFRCQYCGKRAKKADDLTLDHIIPRSKGGPHVASNLVSACKPCNSRKADRTPDQARMPLLTTQSTLRVKLDRIRLCEYAEVHEGWKKYLFLNHEGEEKSLTAIG